MVYRQLMRKYASRDKTLKRGWCGYLLEVIRIQGQEFASDA